MAFPWLHRLVRRRCPQGTTARQRVRLTVERLEERDVPTNLTWVGNAGGTWSTATNWTPAQVPGSGDTLYFYGNTKNTDSTMDLGGGTFYHIAGLVIDQIYTKTITLQSNLYVDVLNMSGGTVNAQAAQSLDIWQRTQGTTDPATKFGTSYFAGGTIKVNTYTYGEDTHQVTLVLAGGNPPQPDLEANLNADAYTTMKWWGGNMTVGKGVTITVNGNFLADGGANRSMGNNLGATGKWNLVIGRDGTLSTGKGELANVNLKVNGTHYKAASINPGGNDVFVVDGTVDQEAGAITEVQSGTLSVTGDFTQNDGSTIVDAGQTLSVAGNFSLSAGSLELGASSSTASIFTVSGDYNQTGGTLQIDVANGVQHAVASIGGAANLGGDLYLYLIDAPLESGITIMTYMSYTGDFANKYTNMFEIYTYTPNSTSYDITL